MSKDPVNSTIVVHITANGLEYSTYKTRNYVNIQIQFVCISNVQFIIAYHFTRCLACLTCTTGASVFGSASCSLSKSMSNSFCT